MSGVDAEKIFGYIESRVAYIVGRMRLASLIILKQAQESSADRITPTLRQFDNLSAHWAFLVPDDPTVRAGLLRKFAERYSFTAAKISRTAEILGFHDEDVREAFEIQFGESVESILQDEVDLAEGVPDILGEEIAGNLQWDALERGEVLLRQGEMGDRLYVVVEGALRVEAETIDPLLPGTSVRRVLAELRPGDIVGEMALIRDEPYLATVTALRNSDLVSLGRADFERLAQQYPELMRAVAVQSIERLSNVIRPMPTIKSSTSIVVLPIGDVIEPFIGNLMTALEKFGRARFITAAALQNEAMSRVGVDDLEAFVDSYDFVEWTNRQEREHRFLLYVGDVTLPRWTRRIIEHADRLLIVGRAESLRARSRLEDLLDGMPNPELTAKKKLVIVHDSRDKHPVASRHLLSIRQVDRHFHVALDHAADFDRLARFLRRRAVGIVFGGGGMRGAAHLGVIKAMRELGIKADFAGGTSAGAIVAAQYGLEWDVERMLRETKDRVMTKKAVMQWTLPIVSFSTAEALNKAYEAMFGGINIEDLWIPVFTIASNLTQAKMQVMDNGSLHRAVRASSSLAGIHPPTIAENNDLLLDGGVFNNTPADVMREKVERGTVIAVDMGFTKRKFPKFNYGDSLSGYAVLWNRINPFRREKLVVPSITSIIMRTNALWSMQLTENQVAHADFVLRPPVHEYGLFNIRAADELFEVGYQYGLEQLGAWKDNGGLRDTYA